MAVTITLSTGTLPANAYSGVHFVRSVGGVDELNFDVHIPLFKGQNLIRPFKTFVTMVDDQENEFAGRVVDVDTSQNNNGTIHVVCEGSAGYLRDSWVFPGSKDPNDEEQGVSDETIPDEPAESSDPFAIVVANPSGGRCHPGNTNKPPPNKSKRFDLAYPGRGTPLSRALEAVKNAHNAFVSTSLRISTILCNCNNLVSQHDLSLAGSTIFDAMNTLADDYGFEWYMRGSVMYVQKKFGSMKGELKTGVTLNSFSKTEDAKDIYTAILPLGGVGYDEKRLSLSGKPCNAYAIGEMGGASLIGYSNFSSGARGRPYIVNEDLYKLYGLRIKLTMHDDIVVNAPEEYKIKRDDLLAQAQVECEELSKQTISVSASAFDFENSPIGGPGPELTVYDYYRVVDYVTGTNIVLRLVGKDTNYDDILNPSLTFALDDRKKTSEKITMSASYPARYVKPDES